MRINILLPLLLIIIPSTFFSQKYILLDSIKKYNVKEYTLDTKDIYNVDKTINIYNVFMTKDIILLLSVLPALEKELIIIDAKQINNNWTTIDIEQIRNQILSDKQIYKLVDEWSTDNTTEKKTMDYKLVKKENGIYYVSKYCLTELFNISSIESPLISSYGVINIMDKKVSIQEMKTSFEKQFPSTEFILDIREENFLRNLSVYYNYRNYLSKEITIKNEIAYQFWTFDGWWAQDGYNEHRGIDRFIYIPKKGIVGGSYDFYFRLKPKISSNKYFTASDNHLWTNIINEKVIIANELK